MRGVNPSGVFTVSYLKLRRIMGILTVGLPIVLIFWGFGINGWWNVESSLSSYYYLRPGDALVGVLVAISFFLITYRGRDRDNPLSDKTLGFYPLTEARTGDLAGLAALLVAFFPNRGGPLEEVVHTAAAISLFVFLAYFCLVHFTKFNETEATEKQASGFWNMVRSYPSRFRYDTISEAADAHKVTRNRIYLLCGLLMVAAIVVAGLYGLFLTDASIGTTPIEDFKLVFWCESVALWAFGVSWFIKGQTFWGDDPDWWKVL